jgi:hypothetical protein
MALGMKKDKNADVAIRQTRILARERCFLPINQNTILWGSLTLIMRREIRKPLIKKKISWILSISIRF